MAHLRPHPFELLIRRCFRELNEKQSIFDLPQRKFFLGDEKLDLSVNMHGHRASSPLGPAAGPHTQMTQNIVLSWLAGCRIMELKTVQVIDDLEIPRPCIDMQTVGYNVEWSQELKLEESLDEYVKASMLIEMLRASGELELAPGFGDVIFDLSVGYDLKGIQNHRVQTFLRSMIDASDAVERLRKQIPDEYKELRDLDFATKLSDTLTLSTFHGCPPDEIEKIIEFLQDELSLNCIVKLNPTLLGPERLRALLGDVMAYPPEIHVPGDAFEADTKWDEAIGFVQRLGDKADSLGLGFGVKFSNTLIVENFKEFFDAKEKRMYLSGQPLHVLAMNLVGDFREHFGDRYPISFSAGIDKGNFADAVAIGLVPVTVCSDLLKTGGYGRAPKYFGELTKRMNAAGASDIEHFIVLGADNAEKALAELGVANDDPALVACRDALAGERSGGVDLRAAAGEHWESWVSAARLLNTKDYVPRATADPRYGAAMNQKGPKKVGTHLVLFDCLTCDKCIPVCPNDANFSLALPKGEVPVVKVQKSADGWVSSPATELELVKKHQIACFADFCNECGNCDVFCPEDGGPYLIKPLFFGSLADWRDHTERDGFCLETAAAESGAGPTRLHGRFSGTAYVLEANGDERLYEGEGFSLRFSADDLSTPTSGEADGEVDLTYLFILELIRAALSAQGPLSYPTARAARAQPSA